MSKCVTRVLLSPKYICDIRRDFTENNLERLKLFVLPFISSKKRSKQFFDVFLLISVEKYWYISGNWLTEYVTDAHAKVYSMNVN